MYHVRSPSPYHLNLSEWWDQCGMGPMVTGWDSLHGSLKSLQSLLPCSCYVTTTSDPILSVQYDRGLVVCSHIAMTVLMETSLPVSEKLSQAYGQVFFISLAVLHRQQWVSAGGGCRPEQRSGRFGGPSRAGQNGSLRPSWPLNFILQTTHSSDLHQLYSLYRSG